MVSEAKMKTVGLKGPQGTFQSTVKWDKGRRSEAGALQGNVYLSKVYISPKQSSPSCLPHSGKH